jgi:hypothetical protein
MFTCFESVQKGGAAGLFLWPSIQAAVSVGFNDLPVLTSFRALNEVIAFSERGSEDSRVKRALFESGDLTDASSSQCSPPNNNLVLSSWTRAGAATQGGSAFLVVDVFGFDTARVAGNTCV